MARATQLCVGVAVVGKGALAENARRWLVANLKMTTSCCLSRHIIIVTSFSPASEGQDACSLFHLPNIHDDND